MQGVTHRTSACGWGQCNSIYPDKTIHAVYANPYKKAIQTGEEIVKEFSKELLMPNLYQLQLVLINVNRNW